MDDQNVIVAGVESGTEVGWVLEGLLKQVINEDILNEREALLKIVNPEYGKQVLQITV